MSQVETLAPKAPLSIPPLPVPPTAAAAPLEAHDFDSSARYKLRVIHLCTVVLPFIGLGAAIFLLWGTAFNWVHLAIMGTMIIVSGLGITVGYHRLFTHKAFRTPAWLRYLIAVAGSMAVQGPVIEWCAEHRRHHQHSDTENDPHSPHMHEQGSWGEGIWATLKGAFHAHVGWLFVARTPDYKKYTRDLEADKVLVAANNQFLFWMIFGMVLPAVLGGLLTWSWMGVLLGFLWGGLVRILLVHHVTWSVNSICHLWGSKPFQTSDESRNNALVAVLGFGEGWHNNHHAFPTSARHGLRWWELDTSWLFIKGLALVGLARDIRVPDRERIESKKRKN